MEFLWYPTCSTCQKAKAFLDAHCVAYTARDIKLNPPTEPELRRWHAASGLPLRRFFNTSGLVYKSLGLKDTLPAMPEDEQYAVLSTDGMLVKRPLLIGSDNAFVLTGFREADWLTAMQSHR